MDADKLAMQEKPGTEMQSAPEISTHSSRDGRPLEIEPDLNFIVMLKKHAGDTFLKCMQCGTCSATCSLSPDWEPFPRKEMVWAAVDRLSPPQRAATLLFYRSNMSCHDIARVLELPVATVKSHLHRARGRLRDVLEPVADQDLQTFRNRLGTTG